MAYKGTETDVLHGVALDRVVMAYKDTETDVLYGADMAWRADATAHALLTRGFTF
jgi:nitric oxide synthase oxygenase domain/subunit